jgi:hypothetical protein
VNDGGLKRCPEIGMERIRANDQFEGRSRRRSLLSRWSVLWGTPAPGMGCARWSSRRASGSVPTARQAGDSEAPGPNLAPHSASRSGAFGHGPCAAGVVAPRCDRICGAAEARYAHPRLWRARDRRRWAAGQGRSQPRGAPTYAFACQPITARRNPSAWACAPSGSLGQVDHLREGDRQRDDDVIERTYGEDTAAV